MDTHTRRVLRRAAARVLPGADLPAGSNRAVLAQVRTARTQTWGPEDPAVLRAGNDLALADLAQGRTGAVTAFERLAATCTRVLGPQHPDTLIVRGNLAAARLADGRAAQAATELAQLHTDRCRVLGAKHRATLNSGLALALAWIAAGHPEPALGRLEQDLSTWRRVAGDDDRGTLGAAALLADTRRGGGALPPPGAVLAPRSSRAQSPRHAYSTRRPGPGRDRAEPIG